MYYHLANSNVRIAGSMHLMPADRPLPSRCLKLGRGAFVGTANRWILAVIAVPIVKSTLRAVQWSSEPAEFLLI
jgi:hypothetical protein